MAVRSRSLGWVRDPGINVQTDLFDVPAGRTAVVRRWSIVNRSTGPIRCVLQVRTSAGVVQVWRGTVPADSTVAEADTNLVLDAGEALVFFVVAGETSSAVHVFASGSLLLGEGE